MKWNKTLLTTSLLGLLLPLTSQAESINVDFTATVTETTCNITLKALNGSKVTDDGSDKYTLTIPDVGLDKIVNATEAAQADFKLVASGCSNGISNIKTKITGAATSGNLIKTTLTDTSAAKNIGMGFKKVGEADGNFIKPDGTGTVTWSTTEITTGWI